MEKIYRKSLLYKTKVEYGDYTMNHVQGCSHGCKFPCYAMLMAKRFGRVASYKEWLNPKIVSNTMELLDIEIPRLRSAISSVHLCFTCDPFMVGHSEVIDLSLGAIEKLNQNSLTVTTLTKGIYPETMIGNGFLPSNEYGITLVSLDEKFRANYEPFTAPYINRIQSLKKLHEAGHTTWVSIEPYPTPNILDQDLADLLEVISFVDKIIFGRLNYNPLANLYPGAPEFYNQCARLVIQFCSQRNIQYHIKQGTITPPSSLSNLF